MKRTLAIILSLMLILPSLVFGVNAAESAVIYIDDINSGSTTQTGPVLLYGSGKTAASFSMSNYDWWDKVVATYDESVGTFVVTACYPATSGDFTYATHTLGANDVMLWTFEWDGFGFGGILDQLVLGDKIYLYGFDFTNAASTDQLGSSNTSSVYFTTHSPSMGSGYYGYVAGGDTGDTEDPEDPEDPVEIDSNVVSLGAKVNTELAGIRFGAEYTRDNDRGAVIAMGTLLLPEDKLGDNELNLEYAETDSLVANVQACTIASEDYVAGRSFEDYESFVYYVTVIGLEGYEDRDIVARPYVTYRSNNGIKTYYGKALSRNINEVAGITTPDDGITSGMLTYLNGYDWSDSLSYQNQIYVYASADATATPASIVGQSVGFLSTWNGIVLEYKDTKEAWEVVVSDFAADGVNAAESATLGDGRLAVIFHNEAVIGQADSYNFLINNAVVGAKFYLSADISVLQSVNGSITNTYLSLTPIEEEETVEPEDPIVGTVSSTISEYDSTGSCTRSYGDTDGLSAVLYAPSGATGISTWLNLGAVHTTLYASEDALQKQQIGAGIATDKDVDNAYLYLCLNSTNWSGDFGLIKRLGDEDWEIVTSEYYYNTWRWNAYSYPDDSGVTVSYDSDYVYWKWNTMDGREALYIKDSEYISDLQLNLISSGNTFTFSINIGDETIFSVSDTATLSSIVLGRAASLTNSSTSTYGSSNYLYQIASSLAGKTPSEMTNIQFYNTYYYTSSGSKKLTTSSGSLWLYPNISSSAGYLVNTEGDPIVTCEEVYLTDGSIMDIINIQNY